MIRLRVATVVGVLLVSACGSKPAGPTNPTNPLKTVSSIAVTGVAASPPAAQTIQLTATATYSDGSTGPVTSSATWSTNAPTIASVDAGGMLRTFRVGAATITATHSGRAGATSVAVQIATEFGTGQWSVGTMIASGRRYADPTANCYWERESGLGGTLGEILANDFVGFDAGQLIVDILPGDVAFKTDPPCGTWFTTPRTGLKTTATPGTWLLNTQLQAGDYQANVLINCYWERVKNFTGTFDAIIANDFVGGNGLRQATILASDAGFTATAECGTWTRVGGPTAGGGTAAATGSSASIAENWSRHRRLIGR